MTLNLNPILDKVRATIENHKIAEGQYARFLWQNAQSNRKLGSNEYGCADAANIRYILGELPRDAQERQACVAALQNFQHPDTGLFWEPTHHTLHCTAHCTAALELFDVRPKYKMKGLDPYRTVDGLYALLEGLRWETDPWRDSHEGAGTFASMILTGDATPAWQDAYFAWLNEHADPEYGMSVRGTIQTGKAPLNHHLNGWFHYMFNYVFARRPFPYAERLVDTCIAMRQNDQLGASFGQYVGFAEIDWVFALNRAATQTGYRFAESKALLRAFAQEYIAFLDAVDMRTHDLWNDLHSLFGAVCALAELQIALPGELRSEYPLRQVLDRRPFI